MPTSRPNSVSLRPSSSLMRTPMIEKIVHTAKQTVERNRAHAESAVLLCSGHVCGLGHDRTPLNVRRRPYRESAAGTNIPLRARVRRDGDQANRVKSAGVGENRSPRAPVNVRARTAGREHPAIGDAAIREPPCPSCRAQQCRAPNRPDAVLVSASPTSWPPHPERVPERIVRAARRDARSERHDMRRAIAGIRTVPSTTKTGHWRNCEGGQGCRPRKRPGAASGPAPDPRAARRPGRHARSFVSSTRGRAVARLPRPGGRKPLARRQQAASTGGDSGCCRFAGCDLRSLRRCPRAMRRDPVDDRHPGCGNRSPPRRGVPTVASGRQRRAAAHGFRCRRRPADPPGIVPRRFRVGNGAGARRQAEGRRPCPSLVMSRSAIRACCRWRPVSHSACFVFMRSSTRAGGGRARAAAGSGAGTGPVRPDER